MLLHIVAIEISIVLHLKAMKQIIRGIIRGIITDKGTNAT